MKENIYSTYSLNKQSSVCETAANLENITEADLRGSQLRKKQANKLLTTMEISAQLGKHRKLWGRAEMALALTAGA